MWWFRATCTASITALLCSSLRIKLFFKHKLISCVSLIITLIYELVFFIRVCIDLINSFGLSTGAFSGSKSVTHPISVSVSVNNFLKNIYTSKFHKFLNYTNYYTNYCSNWMSCIHFFGLQYVLLIPKQWLQITFYIKKTQAIEFSLNDIIIFIDIRDTYKFRTQEQIKSTW